MNSLAGVPRWLFAYGIIWFIAAAAVGATGVLATLRPGLPQVILVSLTVLLVVLGRTARDFRDWLSRLNPRAAIAIHLVRFVGVVFLWLAARGELARAFAVPAGVGDITVATLAVPLLLARQRPGWFRLAAWWNVFGLIDILFVVATATRIALVDQAALLPLVTLPLSLLPTFIVPVIIASHIWLAYRLRERTGGQADGRTGRADKQTSGRAGALR